MSASVVNGAMKTVACDSDGNPITTEILPTGAATETTLATLLVEGTPITGQTLETGGAHGLGWFSSLRKSITDRLPSALVGGRLDVNIGAASGTVPVALYVKGAGVAGDTAAIGNSRGAEMTVPDQPTATTGALTVSSADGSAIGSTVVCAVSGYPGVDIYFSGTHNGYTVFFEVSPDNQTTWYGVVGTPDTISGQSGLGIGLSAALPQNGKTVWTMKGAPATHVRIRCSARTSGSLSVTISPIASDSAPPIQLVTPVKSDGTTANFQTVGSGGYNALTLGPTFIYGAAMYAVSSDTVAGAADGWHNNWTSTVFTSASRTATPAVVDQTNWNGRGCHITINVTSIGGGTPIITPTIQGKDPVSGTYYNILVGTAINSTGITVLKVYPGIATTANAAASDILPRVWTVSMAHTDAQAITYSVGAVVVV